MPLLLVKLRNAVELLWDVLDERERQLLVIGLAYLSVVVVSAVRSSSRDRLTSEVVARLRLERELEVERAESN